MYRWGYGTCVKRWSEIAAPPGSSFVDYYLGGCTTPNTSNTFSNETVYTSNGWRMRTNVDTTIVHETSFSPYSWSQPYNVTFASEAYFVESNVPGSASSPENWSSMRVQNLSDDQWYTTCSNANMRAGNANIARWAQNAINCENIQSWTK